MKLIRRLRNWWRWHYGRPGRGHVTLAQIDEALKHDYLPAIREQLNQVSPLFAALAPRTPEAIAERDARLAEQQSEDLAYADLISSLRSQIDALPLRQRWKLDDEWDD